MTGIRRLFIANRGEIAARIQRTCREMGIQTVAAYTAEESGAPYVVWADAAVQLEGAGPAPYLDVDGLVAAAKRSGADAVHPGYGFLAENAGFARAVIDAGLTWVGPSAEAIASMGDKIEAKRLAKDAGVPVLESMEESSVTFPALVKAAAGGGGKGMRVVRSADDLPAAVSSARREAENAFGDGTLFIEPYIDKSRHVEIQVLGDMHGNVIHLGERECSIQRRHQKIIEESPSPAVDEELRTRMGDAAVSLAKSIGYVSTGTVEFLLGDDGRFFFLEMNTRLQVEHPVTEVITGYDLVREQLRVAMGESIEGLMLHGPYTHAIEARLYAEDPSNDYLPETGTLIGLHFEQHARVDSGVCEGSVISTSFDPMIAKVIAFGRTRREAADSLALSLERSVIQGVRTNRDALVEILRSPEFLAGDTTTDFLERVAISGRRSLTEDERAAAFAAVVLTAEKSARASARVLTTFPSGWRISRMPPQRKILVLDGEETTVEYSRDRDGQASVAGRAAALEGRVLHLDRTTVRVDVKRDGSTWWVHGPWGDVAVEERSPFPSSEIEEVSGSLVAPMPGKVVSINV
ncbi:MAG: biotin carboxylase N-terminal domain-containing protein, partial [Actinomycetota bacterium]